MAAPETFPHEASRALEARIRAERVRVLYDVSLFSFITQLAVVGLIAAALYGAVGTRLLVLWVSAMLMVSAYRVGLYLAYRRATPLPFEAVRWERLFAVGSFAIGLGWGALPAATFPIASMPHEMLIVSTVSAMAIGGLAALQGSRLAFLAFSTPQLVLLAAALFMRYDRVYLVMAGLVLLLFGLLTMMFSRLNRALLESLAARFHNEALVAEVGKAQGALRAAHDEQNLVFDAAPVGIAVIRERRIVRCNRQLEEMFGHKRGTLAGQLTRALYRSEDTWRQTVARIDANLLASGFHDEEIEFYRRDGAPLWCRYRGHAIDRRDPARGVIWVFEDLSEKQLAGKVLARARDAAAAANARLLDAIESVPDAFALFDRDDRLVLCNRSYARLFIDTGDPAVLAGRDFESLVRDSIAKGEVIPPQLGGDVEAWVAERMRRHREPDSQGFVYQLGDGRWLQAKERRTADGGFVAVRTDITALKSNEERIQHLANHDPLTGLPNRRLLADRMTQAVGMARRAHSQVAVMLVDLDDFKRINDAHGHKVGDQVLQVIAGRLRGCVRAVDTVARQGGDEFVIVLPESHAPGDAARVARKVLEAIARPVVLDEGTFEITASLGIALFPVDGDDAETLLKRADIAMYGVKQGGRNGFGFFSAGGT